MDCVRDIFLCFSTSQVAHVFYKKKIKIVEFFKCAMRIENLIFCNSIIISIQEIIIIFQENLLIYIFNLIQLHCNMHCESSSWIFLYSSNWKKLFLQVFFLFMLHFLKQLFSQSKNVCMQHIKWRKNNSLEVAMGSKGGKWQSFKIFTWKTLKAVNYAKALMNS